MLTITLTKICLFLTLTTFLVAIVLITLKSIYGITGINLDNFSPTCSGSFSQTKFSNISAFLIKSFISLLFVLISCLGILIVLYLYFKGEGLIGNDQKQEKQTYTSSKRKLKYNILYLSSSLSHLAWAVIIGQLLIIRLETNNCAFSKDVNITSIFVIGMIGGFLDFANMIVIFILMCLREPSTDQIEENTKRSNEEQSQINKKMDQDIKQYIDKVKRQKIQKQQQLLQYQIKIYESQRQNKQNQQSQYSYYYEGQQIQQTEHQDDKEIDQIDHTEKKILKSQTHLSVASNKKDINQNNNDIQNNESIPVVKAELGIQLKQKDGWQDFQSIIKQKSIHEQPINQQINKLLKITVFKNSQTQPQSLRKINPLHKYFERDDQLDFTFQPTKTKKKNGNYIYSNQVLHFHKQRKRPEKQLTLNQKIIFSQFQKIQLRNNRPKLIGKKRTQKIKKIQQQRYNNLQSCYKKFNVKEYIRSKYQ